MNFKKLALGIVASGAMVMSLVAAPSAMAAGPERPNVTRGATSEGYAHVWVATTDEPVNIFVGPKKSEFFDPIYQDAQSLELRRLYPKIKKGGVLQYVFMLRSATTNKIVMRPKTIRSHRWAEYESSCNRRKPTLMVKAKTRPKVGYVRAVKVSGKNKGMKIVRRLKVELDEGNGSYMLTRKALSKRYRINGMSVRMTEGPNKFSGLKCF